MKHMRNGAALLILLGGLSGCVSTEFASVNTEPGFYYGFGTGPTEAAAQQAAFDDLVFNTLTETGSISKLRKTQVVLTAEMKAALTPLAVKPYLSEKKSATRFNAAYRVKYADWTASETARLATLQADLGERFRALAADPKATTGIKLIEAMRLLQTIDKYGVPLTLRTGAADSPLLADSVLGWAKGLATGITFTFRPDTGLVSAGQMVSVTVSAAGKPLSGIPVNALWSPAAGEAADASTSLNAFTDAKGAIAVPYPSAAAFLNVKPELRLTTRIGTLAPEFAWLATLDSGVKGLAAYRNASVQVDLKTPEALVAGGTFAVGAVSQDSRGKGSKEKPRNVTVKAFYMDTVPVTNAQYKAYLQANDTPKAQWPDFLVEGELAGDNQPVVGVTLAEARQYAAWVSGVLGVTKRLPTEAEYEVAARAGRPVIYPWGDQPPTEGVRANYSGNPKFTATSPVGSFAEGANPLGLLDLVGNVWHWTTSPPDQITAEPGDRIIKGGSWLDGPGELRISNRRAVDPAESASDLGFRLVREASE